MDPAVSTGAAVEGSSNASETTSVPSEVIDLTGLSDSSSEDEDSEGEGHGRRRGLDEEGEDEDDDEGSEVEIHLNQETRTQLHKAISTVSEPRLRHVLKNLIDTDQAVEIALTREFITLRRETCAVVPRWERCMNCDTEYDVNSGRYSNECAFHPGDMEVDWDEGFADWDEGTHGPKDTPENRAQYPDEFKWSCCDQGGSAGGCVEGEHKPMAATKKRKRSD